MKKIFTHEPESHACKGVDEWLSVQGSAPPKERSPVKREATAVRRWSFTIPIFFMLMAGLLYAQTGPTEEGYRNLDDLRIKMMRMRREMDRFMRDVMSTYPSQEGIVAEQFGQDVRVDMTEGDKEIVVRADLPGMDKDRIEITLENYRILRIAGTREVAKEEIAPGFVKQERMQGKFERVLELPAEGMSEGIKASYRNGVLEIVIPKKEQGKVEAVKISVQ